MAQIWLVCFLAAAATAVSNDDIVDRLDGLEQMMEQDVRFLRKTVDSNPEALKDVLALLKRTTRDPYVSDEKKARHLYTPYVDNASVKELREDIERVKTAVTEISSQLTALPYTLCGGTGRTSTNTRLANPTCVQLNEKAVLQGRVEVFHNGSWGTVCDDDFDNEAATVVCRSLGFSNGLAKETADFGEGSGIIWLDQVECSGSEDNIFRCPANDIGIHDCGHGEDVGVMCQA